MTTYIAILRGINVSGKNIIKMDALKQLCWTIGLEHVQTYIQSGNIIFESANTNTQHLALLLQQNILTTFGLNVPTIVIPAGILCNIVNTNPFLKDISKNPDFFHITFLAHLSDMPDEQEIASKLQDKEAISFSPQAVYLYCPNGYGNTKLTNAWLEKLLQVQATTRSWKTVIALMEKLGYTK